MQRIHHTISTADGFARNWDSRINFLVTDECVPFSYTFPPTDEIVACLLEEEATTAITGQQRYTGDRRNVVDDFRGLSIAELVGRSFQLRYPDVTVLDRPGSLFEGFTEQVLNPWKGYLLENEFEWDRCYALARISGPDTCTGYHLDRSNVLFWNVRGRKVFHGFKDPDRWVTLERATEHRDVQIMPDNVHDDDLLSYEVGDDQLVWNHLLTPHWVDAPELTFGVNFSHGGLRHKGRLCRYEQHVYDLTGENPNANWYPGSSSAEFVRTLD